MLGLRADCNMKMIFDSVKSMSVSTQMLNDNGKGGSAIDIWNNPIIKPIPSESRSDADDNAPKLSNAHISPVRVYSASPRNIS